MLHKLQYVQRNFYRYFLAFKGTTKGKIGATSTPQCHAATLTTTRKDLGILLKPNPHSLVLRKLLYVQRNFYRYAFKGRIKDKNGTKI